MKCLDIVNYIAPGFSYDRYMKAYGCDLVILSDQAIRISITILLKQPWSWFL